MQTKASISATIAAAIALAQTEEGASIIEDEYAGLESFGEVYNTQQAAALSALVDALEDYEPDELEDETDFSVHAVELANGSIVYAADVGHNDNMTHTDDWGFASFIGDAYDFEPEWIGEGTSGSFTLDEFDLAFDPDMPYTREQAYQIAQLADSAIIPAKFYYLGSRPVVVELENDQYLVAVLDSESAKSYAILDESDFEELEENLHHLSPHDIEYSDVIYRAMDTASVYCSDRNH